jgi:hypothetical protein
MSAFMPMRGRKDGRDLIGSDSLRDSRPRFSRYLLPISMANLVDGGPTQQQQQQRQVDAYFGQSPFGPDGQQPIREAEPGEPSLAGMMNGRQSMSADQLFGQLQARAPTNTRQAPAGMGTRRDAGLGLAAAELPAGTNNNQLMQAKLRRAFHPMRGKKALAIGWNAVEPQEPLVQDREPLRSAALDTDEF